MGFAGLAIDIGNLNFQKTRLQVAADAAALGGGQDLPNTSLATTDAQQYITDNGELPGNATISFSDNSYQINVSITESVTTYFLG